MWVYLNKIEKIKAKSDSSTPIKLFMRIKWSANVLVVAIKLMGAEADVRSGDPKKTRMNSSRLVPIISPLWGIQFVGIAGVNRITREAAFTPAYWAKGRHFFRQTRTAAFFDKHKFIFSYLNKVNRTYCTNNFTHELSEPVSKCKLWRL